MSDNYIYIVPSAPDWIPAKANQERALAHFRSIAPQAHEIVLHVSEQIEFYDCGANLEQITCPSCGREIPSNVWQDWMEDDNCGGKLVLNPHTTPCCGKEHTVQALIYYWPQAFARCAISAMNPNIGELSKSQMVEFTKLLDCSVKVIYQHL